MKRIFTLLLLGIPFLSLAQTEDENKGKLEVSGFVDAYYAYDFNQPDDNIRTPFVYHFNKHNEFTVNMALVNLNYQSEKYRANVGLMAGTYAQFNLAHEPQVLRNIYEAYAGIKLAEPTTVLLTPMLLF